MRVKRTYLLFLSMVMLSSLAFAQKNTISSEFKRLSSQISYEVGCPIILSFSVIKNIKPILYCSNSYGSTLVYPIKKNNILQYNIPKNITNKIGVVNWQVLNDNHSLSGKFIINPKAEAVKMETYIGPPSINAGGTDYSMLVVIPTDSLDNPITTNTLVKAKHQFLTLEEKDTIFTKNLIAYKNIYSKKESGRILISSECLGLNSKEFTLNVFPAIPTNFKLLAKRPHSYADGNQITIFNTSVITDEYDNVVSDGTFVTYFITNQKGNILKTTGTTIKGVAQAKIIHPDFEDNWSIKAYVDGMAESNTIKLTYVTVIKNFNVSFTDKNRTLNIGPLQSFMQQMIPDGLQVELSILKNNTIVKKYTKTSYNGFVNFKLKPSILKNGTYSFTIQTAGLVKNFNNKIIW